MPQQSRTRKKDRDPHGEYCEVLLRVRERCDELELSFTTVMQEAALDWLKSVEGLEREDLE